MHYRQVFTIALNLVFLGSAGAIEIYVSPAGDDAATGKEDSPLRSITAAMERAQPGDVCILLPGLYRETVRPVRDGRADAPITVRASESGQVILSGTEPLGDWQAAEEQLWRAACPETVSQIFWQGEMLPQACWPNTTSDPMKRIWAEAGPGSVSAEIHDASLPPLDLAGATAHVLPGAHWVSWTRQVKAIDPAIPMLILDAPMPEGEVYQLNPGSRYFLFDHRALLDAPGEWRQDPETLDVFLVPPDGTTREDFSVEVKRREVAVDLRGLSHVRVEGLHLFGATIRMDGAKHCAVENCHVRFASHFTLADGWNGHNDSGVVISGNGNVLRRSSVQYSAGNGISLLGEGNTVENCLVRYADYAALDCAAVWAEGTGNAIRRCTLSDTGRSVLVHRTLKQGRIENNNMYNAGLMTADLGITYCFQTDGEETVIAHNWVHDNHAHTGVGIYIDNGSSNFLIYRNVSWNNADSGIRLNTPSYNNRVYHNTVLKNGNSLSYWGAENNRDQEGCRVHNNIFTDKVETGDGIVVRSNSIGDEPQLVDADALDFRLQESSPCIDAGEPLELAGGTDAAPDLGAYEFDGEPWRAGHDWGDPPPFQAP